MLKNIHGKDINAACIGQAGEKLSLLAVVINDKGRAAGRAGRGGNVIYRCNIVDWAEQNIKAL